MGSARSACIARRCRTRCEHCSLNFGMAHASWPFLPRHTRVETVASRKFYLLLFYRVNNATLPTQ